MDMSKYIEIFIEESKEHLQNLNQNLLNLEKKPSEPTIINEIFRIAHTLKGMAGTMGYNKMTSLTHSMEDTFHLLRTGEIKITTELVDILFRCLDALEAYVTSIINVRDEGEVDNLELTELLSKIAGKGNRIQVNNMRIDNTQEQKMQNVHTINTSKKVSFPIMRLDKYESSIIEKAKGINNFVYRIDLTLHQSCLLKSARAFIFFQMLERHGEIIKSVPPVQDIEDEKFDFEISVVLISKATKEDIISDLERLSEVECYEIYEIERNKNVQFENLHIEEVNIEEPIKVIQETIEPPSKQNRAKSGKTVRVDIERLDVLMNLVSELIIVKTVLDGIKLSEKNSNFSQSIEYLERITTSLHDSVMKVRMVPVETVFNRFPRMIRDIARELGKDISLEMRGEETEFDRTVIDEIGDPLIHLLRNSVDHGIETQEQRRSKGKPEKGHIYLRSYPDGNNVVIEVEDDGCGIDIEKVRNSAVKKGLVSQDIASTLTNDEVIKFLFNAGFSTKDTITDLSGRGVGLDVVKYKIESLGGLVEVDSKFGLGTKFSIRLPLTLAIIQALLVRVGEEEYAISLGTIKEVIRVLPEEIKFLQKKEVMILRDLIIPIVWLEKIFEVSVLDTTPKKSYTVVVVKRGDKYLGIVVDSLIGQQEIVIKSLGRLLSKLRIIAGATILGNGNVALIVDVNSL